MTTAALIFAGTLNGVVLGGVAGVLAAAALTGGQAATTAAPTYHQGAQHSVTAGHHCWSGEAPKSEQGKIPGGVVVSRGHSAKQVYLHTPAAVGAALDHAFKGTHPGMTVWAFCA